MSKLPEIRNYSMRDYSTILQELEDWVTLNKPEYWSDFFESNLGELLIELIAYHGDLLSFAIDRVGEETFLKSCRRYKSGLKHAELLGYKPYQATAASVDVRVTPLPANIATYGVQIEKGTQIRLGNDVVFEVDKNYSFPAGSTAITFSLQEGQTVDEEFESNGTEFITFTTENINVIDHSWSLYVDGVEWTEVDYVELTPHSGNVYCTQYEGDRSITVRFGNGITGGVPPYGATIKIVLRIGGGEKGNVQARSIVTAINAIQNGQQISLNVINDYAASGGSEREKLDHVKRWAPLNVKTVDKAITRQDYETEAGSFADASLGAIARASAKLRVGTLAVPDPGPADYTIVEAFDVVTDITENDSLGKCVDYNDKVAFSFQLSSDSDISRVSFNVKKHTIPGSFKVRVETDDAGKPSGTLVDVQATASVSDQSVYGEGWIRVRLDSQISLLASTTYWIVLELDEVPDAGAYYELRGDSTGGYVNGKYMRHNHDLDLWIDAVDVLDVGFQIEIGGPYVVHADDPIVFDGQIYKAKSEFTITGNNMAIFLDPNTVDVYVWAETTDTEGRKTFGPVSSALKQSLLNHLDERAVVCTISFIHDGGVVPIDINLGDVYVDAAYDLDTVSEAIKDATEAFFTSEDIQPGTAFLLSDYYTAIESVTGVLHFVERKYYNDIQVSDTEMIIRGDLTFTCKHPTIDILTDITARY